MATKDELGEIRVHDALHRNFIRLTPVPTEAAEKGPILEIMLDNDYQYTAQRLDARGVRQLRLALARWERADD